MSRVRQEVVFAAPVQRVYKAIALSEDHAAFTGQPADIGQTAGEAWSAYNGEIHGLQIELVANRRIVQAWRAKVWPEGVYSMVTFEFADEGAGTKLTLTHDAIPEGEDGHLETGWPRMYWTPLKTYLAG